MIVAENSRPPLAEFQSLMSKVDNLLNEEARNDSGITFNSGGLALEPFVLDAAVKCAKNTAFEGSIQLVSGASFPDIVAANYYGIEVKSTMQNHWTSIGSSILESTRIDSVERIYLTFGKLGRPIQFKSRPYEECLSGIAVTHYPRYQIDMTLKKGETIFDKMGVSYEELKSMKDPVSPVADYYRKQLKPGESLWWAGNHIESAVPATVRLWSSLSPSEKDDYEGYAYVYFPECVLLSGNKKYSRMTLWLATQCGIINSNVRDSFSAGGRVSLKDENGFVHQMPAVFNKIKLHINQFKSVLFDTPSGILREFWEEPISIDRINQWLRLVTREGKSENEKKISESVLRRIFKDSGLL